MSVSGNLIYIVTHNANRFPPGAHFRPIQSGRALNPDIEDIIGDNTGDNISALNPYFAEIAPMYWVWKNAEPVKMVGFFHYRRFLNFGAPVAPNAHWMDRNFHDFSTTSLERFSWTEAGVEAALSDCDIAVPEAEIASLPPHWQETCTLYDHYRNAHGPSAINLALQVLREVHPHDVSIAEDVIFGNRGYFCHMYVMRWQLFCEYMSWLFSIFSVMQKRMDLDVPYYGIDTGNQRVFGFVGERFFNIFVEKARRRGARVKEFERLFGHIKASPGRASPPRREKRKLVRRIHGGFEFNVLGRNYAIYEPD